MDTVDTVEDREIEWMRSQLRSLQIKIEALEKLMARDPDVQKAYQQALEEVMIQESLEPSNGTIQ
jgi:hypothetical protein